MENENHSNNQSGSAPRQNGPSTQNLYPVVTVEHGMGFAIVRDTYTKSGYRAEIIAFPVDKSQLKAPPHRDESVRQEGAVA